MVPVTPDHVLELGGLLGIHPELALFVDHGEAEFVAQVQQRGAGRVVRAADGVESVFAQLLQPVAPQGVGNARPHAGVVLMQVAALQLHAGAVQQEALLRVEGDFAQAAASAVFR